MNTSKDVLVAAARHHGASVVEILQNCVIFNDGIHNYISDKTTRAERTIILRHGEKMVFGANNDKGIVLDGFKLKAVTIGQDGYTMDDVLVHDATEPDNALHFKLAMMGCMGDTDMPVAMGVIRNVDAPTYDACVEQQVEEVKNKKKDHNLMELLMQGETWEVK